MLTTHPVLMSPGAADHHQVMPAVERLRRIQSAFYDLIVALPGSDKRTRQLHKDIQSRYSRCADHLALMVDSALTKREESKVRAIANALIAFCEAGVSKIRRAYSAIYRTETREQGELDNVELAVQQGDLSAQTLDRLISELTDNISVMTEMKEWALHERYVRYGAHQ